MNSNSALKAGKEGFVFALASIILVLLLGFLLAKLLKIEKKEDFEQHRKVMDSLSPEQRRAKGLAWYPLNAIQQGYTIGERAFVVVERTQGKGQEHQFRAGKTVRFYTQHSHKPTGDVAGRHFFP